ncbi:uncharacterized protein LOC127245167 [Andrographis paniculata]|uniref:uncharacterized protein LOC127245167 n=1 Tax=Andrographis paniculata TaxID=175694 RepID=UPI0021E95ED6|nr:uncharacterized protein LOC127245167 [Andrographis paniculata]
MSGVRNSVETVNAAATAIVAAESRVQPDVVQKRRWSSCWSIYWCFGSYKQSKRIGHAVLVSDSAPTGVVPPVAENGNHSSTIVLPFVAPPSSPASFLQSDPQSSIQSPSGLLSLASLSVHVQSPGGTAPIFTIGPYAHETQLVSPPVFSTFTTEPSTASFTPPPEPVHQMTTPSSPEVPFAELLSSSLARSRRSGGTSMKYLSQYEYKPYQYPGSPGSHARSPGSAVSTSGTSSPFPDKRPIIGYEHFPNYKWDSRVGSGSLTPNDGISRFGSGALTPNGGVSRLGSGALTPNGGISRLGSGTLTPNGGGEAEIPTRNGKISEVKVLVNSDDAVVGHRVSFELFGEDIPTCTVSAPIPPLNNLAGNLQVASGQDAKEDNPTGTTNTDNLKDLFNDENVTELPSNPSYAEEEDQKSRTISLGSSKDFNFNNAKGSGTDKSSVECEWWTNDTAATNEESPRNSWSFFPMLRSEAR